MRQKADKIKQRTVSFLKIQFLNSTFIRQRDKKRKGLFQKPSNVEDPTSIPSNTGGNSPLTSPQHKVGVVITSSRQAHRRFVFILWKVINGDYNLL